jgi:hypothetical protein
VAEVLKSRGVSLSETDENGCIPLHYAALKHQPYNLAKFYIGKTAYIATSSSITSNATHAGVIIPVVFVNSSQFVHSFGFWFFFWGGCSFFISVLFYYAPL